MIGKEVIHDKKELVRYIATKYEEQWRDVYENLNDEELEIVGELGSTSILDSRGIESEIGNIRLHKTLYFLYAYWIKFNAGGEEQLSEIMDEVNYSNRLFKADFRAWRYGPADEELRDILKEGKVITFTEEELIDFRGKYSGLVLGFIDDLLFDINRRNDFALVDLSTEDSAWVNNFDPQELNNNKPISHQEIVEDYQ